MGGSMEQTYVRGKLGHVILNPVGPEALLIVLTTPEARLGVLFLDIKRRVQELSNWLHFRSTPGRASRPCTCLSEASWHFLQDSLVVSTSPAFALTAPEPAIEVQSVNPGGGWSAT